jgi:hypothetical protein
LEESDAYDDDKLALGISLFGTLRDVGGVDIFGVGGGFPIKV